ncbi:adenosylmethionine decarboxylase [Hydrogenothermus marinus]|uniref:S-adenosylmethionine decarboxylase n=1 Tax=Hydrogenothermus marinus TaxID=133270 RepID=A0A3M0BIA2_9AQUI|nr:adenosylmethionine decarboxylase [Hydrogenothermus marinus]RMA96049.1 S-adenosylmethionine decarboxylase [Hydrogenothermus marinus]
MIGFGPHLMVDGYNANYEKLASVEAVTEFLETTVSEIGMTKIMPPYVFKYDGGDKPEDWGVSGFVIIAESHISIHTFPEKRYFSIDIFSCKDFDIDKAIKLIKEYFETEDLEIRTTDRGTEFPRDISIATSITNAQRNRLT